MSVISTELSISSLQLEGKRDHQQTHHGPYSQVGEMRVPVIDCSVRLCAVKWVLWEVTVHCGEEAANNPKTGRTILQPVRGRTRIIGNIYPRSLILRKLKQELSRRRKKRRVSSTEVRNLE